MCIITIVAYILFKRSYFDFYEMLIIWYAFFFYYMKWNDIRIEMLMTLADDFLDEILRGRYQHRIADYVL